MSLIDFESNRDIQKKRDEERKIRETIIDKAKEKYYIEEYKREQAEKRGENSWMLPSVDAKIDSKHKKKKKKKKKHSSSENEHEEKEEKITNSENKCSEPIQRDDWMNMESFGETYTRKAMAIRDGSSRELKALEEKKRKELINKPGNNSLELNPHYKNGGSGLPEVEKPKSSLYDSAWLLKALERAKTQAKEEGRSLEDVARDRWGSLEKFYKLLDEAKGVPKSVHTNAIERKRRSRSPERKKKYHRSRSRDRYHRSRSRDRYCRSRSRDRYRRSRSRDRYKKRMKKARSSSASNSDRERSSKKDSNKKYYKSRRSSSSSRSRSRSPRKDQQKKISLLAPVDSDEERMNLTRTFKRNSLISSSNPSWKKSTTTKNDDCKNVEIIQKEEVKPPTSPTPIIEESEPIKILSDKEMNQLAAKLTKAELLGNEAQVSKLKKKLEKARKARETEGKQLNDNSSSKAEEEIVVLTRANASGYIRPAVTEQHNLNKRQKNKKSKTHDLDGQRERYFADDDQYSLKAMFEKEKNTSIDDQIKMFHKGISSNAEKLSDDFDIDDMFMSKVAPKENVAKQKENDRKMAIAEHQAMEKTLDSCYYCIDSKLMKKHLIVSLGSKCYLSVPQHASLVEGHCLISPLNHIPCSTRVDEDLWEEIQNYRHALVKMFASKGEDCVFFETAVHIKKHPHMVIECVPLPKEVGEMAPIYFKKAILECEEEWAQNKKLIDLKGKSVRKAVPVGLPYFSVDFGMCPGFAHVIENEYTFGKSFAQEILGGMLDIDACYFRRPKAENFDEQRKKVIAFAKDFEKFDITS